MQFDSQERKPIFYVFLFGALILSIVFFINRVKYAINSGKNSQETTSQSAKEEKKSAPLVLVPEGYTIVDSND